MKEREELEKKIKTVLDKIKHNRQAVNQLKESMSKYGVLPGEAQKILIGNEPIEDIDLGLLCILTIATHEVTGDLSISPHNFFTNKEITLAKQRDYKPESNDLRLPLTFENVLQVGAEDYITVMSIKDVVRLFKSNLLQYNFETQRNAKVVRRKDKIVLEPNINKRSVREIKELVKNNAYLPDTITLNVLAGSAEDGEEIVYDAAKKQLTIKSGEIDILDGFHRINGFVAALEEDDVDLNIQVAIKNYSTRKAQTYVGQINTINKMDPSHLKALKADRYSDTVVKELQRESDLRGKVSQTSRPSKLQNHLVSYSMLADTIDQQFTLNSKKEALELAEYLTRFFDMLIGSYPDAFMENIEEIREKSLINNNNTFAGYIVLAKRMKEENISLSKLKNIIDSIDFSRDNPMWEEIGVLEKGRLSRRSRNSMIKFFEDLDLEGVT